MFAGQVGLPQAQVIPDYAGPDVGIRRLGQDEFAAPATNPSTP